MGDDRIAEIRDALARTDRDQGDESFTKLLDDALALLARVEELEAEVARLRRERENDAALKRERKRAEAAEARCKRMEAALKVVDRACRQGAVPEYVVDALDGLDEEEGTLMEDDATRLAGALTEMAARANTARGASWEHGARSATMLTDAVALIARLTRERDEAWARCARMEMVARAGRAVTRRIVSESVEDWQAKIWPSLRRLADELRALDAGAALDEEEGTDGNGA